jgi:histidinol-phosphate aminotransferase
VARGVPTIEEPLDQRFDLDEAAMIAAIEQHKPTVVFLALPNNPTGTLWRMTFATELAARFRDTVIVSDEAYFAYCHQTSLPALAEHPNLVVMRTLSKVGLAGLRVGFTISSRAIARVLEKVRPPYNVSALDQRAAELAITEARDWCASRASDVIAERARLALALADRGIHVFPSRANLVLIRVPDAPGFWKRLADAGIVVRLFDRGPLTGCLRITVGTPSETDLLLGAL